LIATEQVDEADLSAVQHLLERWKHFYLFKSELARRF